MRSFKYFIIFMLQFFNCQVLFAQQSFTINPYLQNAEPNSIYILWETELIEESFVEWGLTDTLGNVTTGISHFVNNGNEVMHEVHLEKLKPFTRYYYRVKSGNIISGIYKFKTPPTATENVLFRVVVMSDMQMDDSFPNKFNEIIEEGLLSYIENVFDGDLVDNIALVMIPGDLVEDGNDYSQWRKSFFKPAQELFRQVPVYPVLGNHEENASSFFTYFKLPENGTPDYKENWWFKDYRNVRIIGMNSNSPYDDKEQLDWLDSVLTSTCIIDSIDFVFAQLHHPFKSELWTIGESNFTGEVIARLEQFSTNCKKPSIHFFGHTHAYSRGQSRDHKHLWINVATAGGQIDNWGESSNIDYDEYTVSQDEYGFVMIEITPGDDPMLVMQRISVGDQNTMIDNDVTDSLTLKVKYSKVNTPQAVFPVDISIAPECVKLIASDFSAPYELSTHGQSHWQVDIVSGNFSSPEVDIWRNYENWYDDKDLQVGDDLTDEVINGLVEFTNYKWRVRYRDKEMNWSKWSFPVDFSTSESISSQNLIANSGAEEKLSYWVVKEGVVESLESLDCNGMNAYNGDRYFAVGGLCEHSEVGKLVQNIDVSDYIDSIDMGKFRVNFGGYLSNYTGYDKPEMKLIFLDENNNNLGQSEVLSTLFSKWTLMSLNEKIPLQTRTIQVGLKGVRNSGTDNDSYFDDLFLNVSSNFGCDSLVYGMHDKKISKHILDIFPNPTKGETKIIIPKDCCDGLSLQVIDMVGNRMNPNYRRSKDGFIIQTTSLLQGVYFIILSSEKGPFGFGRLFVIKN